MKTFVSKNINEFQRGKGVKAGVGIGKIQEIEKDLESADLSLDDVDIDKDFLITLKPSQTRWKPSHLLWIQLKYMKREWGNFVSAFVNEQKHKYNMGNLIEEAIDDGIPIDKIEKLVDIFASEDAKRSAQPTISKHSRTEEEKGYDEDQNIYIFIGFMDKVAVDVNGKTYYEEKFAAETLVKIDKFKMDDLLMVPNMKMRASTQYPDGRVYMVQVPNYYMDEKTYDGIPDEYHAVVDQYKKKI